MSRTTQSRKRLLALAASACLIQMTFAWGEATSLIEAERSATVEAVPDYAEFTFYYGFSESSIIESVSKALRVDAELREELAKRQLAPISLKFSGARIAAASLRGGPLSSYRSHDVEVEAQVRLGLQGIANDPEEGLFLFASLCDAIRQTAKAQKCMRLEGPHLGVNDEERLESAAVLEATDATLPVAEAVAASVNAAITVLDKVVIQKIEWHNATSATNVIVGLQPVACTAKVKVDYAFEASDDY